MLQNMAEAGKAARTKDYFRKGRDLALQGIVGGAAWWLVGAVAVVVAGFLKGTIPAGPAIIVFLVVLGVSASISTALMRRADRAEGERDEAQRQAAADRARALEIENQADVDKRGAAGATRSCYRRPTSRLYSNAIDCSTG